MSKKEQDEIIELFRVKPQFEKRIDWNKLDILTYDDFRPLLMGGEVKIKRGQAKEGVDYIEIDSTHLTHKAFIPLTYEGSIYLASNAVGGDFKCSDQKSGKKFTEEEVRAVCNVKGKVIV